MFPKGAGTVTCALLHKSPTVLKGGNNARRCKKVSELLHTGELNLSTKLQLQVAVFAQQFPETVFETLAFSAWQILVQLLCACEGATAACNDVLEAATLLLKEKSNK